MLIIDEPDIYLHPNPQRQLLSILKSSGPDILLATHSSEIVAEAEYNDILVIDKTQRSAKRVSSPGGVQSTLGSLGSVHTVTMSTIAQTRRVLYTEGEDFKVIRRLARRLNLSDLASGVGIAPFSLGGFPSTQRLKAVTLGVSESVGGPIIFSGVFDRDFRPDEEIDELQKAFGNELELAVILKRKEIENYLLVPTVIERTLDKLLQERARHNSTTATAGKSIAELLGEITTPMKTDVESQYIGKRGDFFDRTGKDASTISLEAIQVFERKWNDDGLRLHIVPGKKVLRDLISQVQCEYKVTLTPARIIEQFREIDMPLDLRQTLRSLESFRCQIP